MKRLIITVAFLLIPVFATAGILEEKQWQLVALQHEFAYCQERMKNIQAQAEKLNLDVRKLKAEAKKLDAEKTKEIENEKTDDSRN